MPEAGDVAAPYSSHRPRAIVPLPISREPPMPSFIPDLPVILAFALASFVLAVTPGPDMALFVSRTINHGLRHGMVTMAGALTGIAVHTCLAAFGISVLIVAAPTAFWVLKIAGALYLLWLAIQAIRDGGEEKEKLLLERHGFPVNFLPGRTSAHSVMLPYVLRPRAIPLVAMRTFGPHSACDGGKFPKNTGQKKIGWSMKVGRVFAEIMPWKRVSGSSSQPRTYHLHRKTYRFRKVCPWNRKSCAYSIPSPRLKLLFLRV